MAMVASPKHHQGDGPPPTKRSKHSDNTNGHHDEETIDSIQRAWVHYRNFIGGGGDDTSDDDDDEEEEEEEDEGSCTGSGGSNKDTDDRDGDAGDMQDRRPEGEAEAEGGDVDELLELIEILSSTEVTVPSALALSTDDPSSGNGADDYAIAADQTPPLQSIESLVPILLSMSYLHLASHAISEIMFEPTDNEQASMNEEEEEDDEKSASSSSTPNYYLQKSLHYWPTNPAVHSVLANYRRTNSLSSTEDICGHYVKAARYARRWRGMALDFLRSSTEEEEEEEEVEDCFNPKEWVELLVLNGALDVDYIGGDDDEDEDEDAIGSTCDGKQQEEEEEYSFSRVEATASFLSAFLLSTLSKHEDALEHLQKFRLSHRIHPNVWKEAQQSHGSNRRDAISARRNGRKDNKCNAESTTVQSTDFFPPRMYHGAAGSASSSNKITHEGDRGILPTHLYKRMCTLLAPNAPYWKESDYNDRGYYSYYIDLDATAPTATNDSSSPSVRDCPTNIIEDVIVNCLLPLAEQTLRENETDSSSPRPPRIVGAEWWTHTRPLGANLGHQVHFDTDESFLGRENKVAHPIVSSVLYLTGTASGANREGAAPTAPGSTVVFDQTPRSKDVAPRAWVSRPENNSFMTFPGNLLHGVLPCAGGTGGRREAPSDDGGGGGDEEEGDVHRLTLMVGFWTRDVTDGMGERQPYTPCGPLPPATSEHSWVMESRGGYCRRKDEKDEKEENNSSQRQEQQSKSVFDILPSVSPAWERFDGNDDSKQPTVGTASLGGGPTLMVPKGLDHRFFVWNAPHCFSESLFEKEDCF